jgi:hypothetical protein
MSTILDALRRLEEEDGSDNLKSETSASSKECASNSEPDAILERPDAPAQGDPLRTRILEEEAVAQAALLERGSAARATLESLRERLPVIAIGLVLLVALGLTGTTLYDRLGSSPAPLASSAPEIAANKVPSSSLSIDVPEGLTREVPPPQDLRPAPSASIARPVSEGRLGDDPRSLLVASPVARSERAPQVAGTTPSNLKQGRPVAQLPSYVEVASEEPLARAAVTPTPSAALIPGAAIRSKEAAANHSVDRANSQAVAVHSPAEDRASPAEDSGRSESREPDKGAVIPLIPAPNNSVPPSTLASASRSRADVKTSASSPSKRPVTPTTDRGEATPAEKKVPVVESAASSSTSAASSSTSSLSTSRPASPPSSISASKFGSELTSEPARVEPRAPSQASTPRESDVAQRGSTRPSSRSLAASATRGDVELIDHRGVPDVSIVRTSWHPDATRRSARVRLEESNELVTLREGDAVGSLVVQEITPSAVVFSAGAVEIRRRVGQGG